MHIINILLMLMTKILILKKVEKKEIFKNLKKKCVHADTEISNHIKVLVAKYSP